MLTTTREQVQSWSKDLKHYEKSKQKLSWKRPPPVNHVHDWQVKSKDYEFNPVLQKYNDPYAERQAQKKEAQSRAVISMRSRASSIRNEREFNIINGKDNPYSKQSKVGVSSDHKQSVSEIFNKSFVRKDSVEGQLPINKMARKTVNPSPEKEKQGSFISSKASKRPSAAYSRRFNPLKIANPDIRFIDNGLLVTNIIEVRTPPPPMYEEEMEEEKRLAAMPKYNKNLYASSSSSRLSSVESENESNSSAEQKKKHKKPKKKHKKNSHKEKDFKLPEISSKYTQQPKLTSSKVLKQVVESQAKTPTRTNHGKPRLTVHSIRSLASELLVQPSPSRPIAATESSAKQYSVVPRRPQIRTGAFTKLRKQPSFYHNIYYCLD